MISILNTLSTRMLDTLQTGKRRLDEDAIGKLKQFVKSQRIDDAFFMDKKGDCDLYYTCFGLILSFILNMKINHKRLKAYLDSLEPHAMDLIHYLAYMRCKMLSEMIQNGKAGFLLNNLFTAKTNGIPQLTVYPHQDPESPYSQFLMLSLKEETGIDIKDKKSLIQSLDAYKVPEGGYTNIRGNASASTNATVAALSVIGQLDGYSENKNIRFLQGCQDESGGFYATAKAPLPDLLSTATSLFLLKCYEVQSVFSPIDFIEAHWQESGGFSATILEECSDVEYTFYGLLALGAWK